MQANDGPHSVLSRMYMQPNDRLLASSAPAMRQSRSDPDANDSSRVMGTPVPQLRRKIRRRLDDKGLQFKLSALAMSRHTLNRSIGTLTAQIPAS